MNDHFVNKTNTPADEKDLWQTPKKLFDKLNDEFDFQLDCCASLDNRLCDNYFSERISFLDYQPNHFGEIKAAFINPPYSDTSLFLTKVAQDAVDYNITFVAIVNANTDTKWFADAVKSANEVRLFTGRISFIKPDGKKASGNPKGQCLIIWRGNCKTPCQITMVDRNELIEDQS